MGMECGAYASGASNASVRGVSDNRRRCAKGSNVGLCARSDALLSTDFIKAGGRGGGAYGEVKASIRSRVGEGGCMIEAGRLLAFRSKVSTSALVKLEMLLV